MINHIMLEEIVVKILQKDIKNLHLSVFPPSGNVQISAPLWMNIDSIRAFSISKLSWIKQQQKKLRQQRREPFFEYLDRESHYLWGKRYLLQLIESNQVPTVELKHNRMCFQIGPHENKEKKQSVIEAWYRKQLRHVVPVLIAKWESLINVQIEKFFIQKMKTKWGSCNTVSRSIRLNTELAKKPREYLEYIVVHERVHLLEPTHNHRFVTLMNQFMPKWRFYRDELNQSLLGYVSTKSAGLSKQ